jgi:CheY-like chemotaxis protein
LLDVGLPDGSGIDVCAEIKARDATVPVVLISAVYRTSDARRDAFSAGADAYLIEPVSPELLVRTVRELTTPDARPSSEQPPIFRTTAFGEITRINGAAADLLNTGSRFGVGRNILQFFDGQRAQVQAVMAAAASGRVAQVTGARWRPRERKPFNVTIDVSRTDAAGAIELEWVFEVLKDSASDGSNRKTH